MLETEAYAKIKNWLGTSIFLQRINQARVPDFFFRCKWDGWIEVKVVRGSVEKGFTIPFKPGQFSWIKRYIKKGGTAYLFCFVDDLTLVIFQQKNIQEKYTYEETWNLCCFRWSLNFPAIGKELKGIFGIV